MHGAGVDGADRHHAGLQRPDFAGHDGLQGGDKLRRDDDRVDGGVRVGGVAGDAVHHDAQAVAGGVGCAAHEGEAAGGDFRVVVEAERHVHAVQRTVGDHRAGAAQHFLGGLEEQAHGARELGCQALQDGGDAQEGSAVHVVPAGVHDALVLSC